MLGKILRIVAIILIGLASTLMILGGIGTICIAWFPENWESLAVMAPYKLIFQAAVIFTLLAGFTSLWATVKLIRREKNGWNMAVIALLLSLATAGTKMYFSNMARGSVAPTNIRFYFSLFVLVYFLVMRIPPLWEKVGFEDQGRPDEDLSGLAGGTTAIVAGLLTLTVHLWAGPTHTVNGVNYVEYLHTELMIAGSVMVVAGLIALTLDLWNIIDPQNRTTRSRGSSIRTPTLH
ncbi:MAG: hypothetical protein U9R25_17430 [Chloroflexota bacterium]|nr:hypothetical protein [Chloroflexota bacterium]